jgi:hypothetical protein
LFIAGKADWRDVTVQTFDAVAQMFVWGNPNITKYYDPVIKYGGDARAALLQMASESVFICSARRTARYFLDAGAPVYLYSWDHAPEFGNFSKMPWTGAFHFSEVPFVFGNALPLDSLPVSGFSPAEIALGANLRNYWVSFAESAGNPNSNNPLSAWPQFSRMWKENIFFQNGSTFRVGNDSQRDGGCDLFDRVLLQNVPWPRGFLGEPVPQPAPAPVGPTTIIVRETTTGDSEELKSRSSAALAVAIVALLICVGLGVALLVKIRRTPHAPKNAFPLEDVRQERMLSDA